MADLGQQLKRLQGASSAIVAVQACVGLFHCVHADRKADATLVRSSISNALTHWSQVRVFGEMDFLCYQIGGIQAAASTLHHYFCSTPPLALVHCRR